MFDTLSYVHLSQPTYRICFVCADMPQVPRQDDKAAEFVQHRPNPQGNYRIFIFICRKPNIGIIIDSLLIYCITNPELFFHIVMINRLVLGLFQFLFYFFYIDYHVA